MNNQYDYDVKNDLIGLLEARKDYSGMPEMSFYLERYHQESNIDKQSLQRFLIYRLASDLEDRGIREFDCDVCKKVTDSYLRTYTWLDGYSCKKQDGTEIKYELKNGITTYRGDTMTSAWVPIKNYIKLKLGVNSNPKGDSWKLYFLRNIGEIELSEEAGRFLRLTHSIGNFIPVPMGFNVGRSGYYGNWDSWDLTLTHIFNWYADNTDSVKLHDNSALRRLFEYAQENYMDFTVRKCEVWLESFGTWESFVKKNYLDAFVDEQGVPRKFYSAHSLDRPIAKSKNIEEFEMFFKTCNECIEQRGKQITEDNNNQW
ncbi:MAG: hypothetical protein Q3982_08020 [Phoenicibacter congonensis]|uniref:Uncharacterized protein n=1 Tax=Phoenicibacter congonensis TaxID=1944646 RepID=A0AA43RIV4_9ACTN|nr:hypothetical protein [Phoenicibacter congonensis]